jgi:alpha/beta superfamily hydrolase
MTRAQEERIEFFADGNRLEGVWMAPSAPSRIAVVLHPHPEYGGDMDNHVVLALARVLGDGGAATLRFNFRGTGASTGLHDRGVGEAADVRAALAYARERVPGVPAVLAGYSFGAQVAISAAVGEQLSALVLVSPPLAVAAAPPLPGLPVLAIGGDADPICPPDRLAALAEHGARVLSVAGADHGWWGHTRALQDAVREFVATIA